MLLIDFYLANIFERKFQIAEKLLLDFILIELKYTKSNRT